MWLLNCPLDKSYQETLKPLLIKYEVEALWLIGSRSRNDFTDKSDWDFMILFRRFSTKQHEGFERELKPLFKEGASALSVYHVVTVLPPEHRVSVIHNAIPLWKT